MRHAPNDPHPDSPVARIRDAVNDAFDRAVAEHAPDAGVAFIAAVSVGVDGGETLDLDTRTTVRADLGALQRAGVELGAATGGEVAIAILGVLAQDTADAVRGPDPRLN